ncbi:hypothetical protein BLNAU_456 [Blattamonas nauphoetae]|uniref:Uncharacterized protein n=1 Tax=Blattamonas nauphoetae TaxID=2049346 RepID=A0ABQ9YLA6_9EUKA|nr:hypothetical protein BLNAU_456 [Blattamonas nauphoetae]
MKFIEERSSDVLTLLPEPIFSSLTISTHLENSVPIHSSTTFPSFSNKPEEQDEIFQVDDLMFGSSYHSPWNTLPFITTDAALSLIQPSLRFSKNRRECDSWIDQIRSSKSPLPQHPSHSKAIPAVPWMDEITIKSTDYISSVCLLFIVNSTHIGLESTSDYCCSHCPPSGILEG